MLFEKIQTSKKDEPQSQFSHLTHTNLLLYFIYFLANSQYNQLSNKILHIVLYLVNIILEILELFLMGLISVLRENLLLLTYTFRKHNHQYVKANIALNNNLFKILEYDMNYQYFPFSNINSHII